MTAKLITDGSSQAVQLPQEFHFEGTEVNVERDPATGGVLLYSHADKRQADWLNFLDLAEKLGPLVEDEFPYRDTRPPDTRDIF